MTMKQMLCATAAIAAAVAFGDENSNQVNEANAVFNNTKPPAIREVRGGSWKVVYSSLEGPHRRALQTLTERLGNYFLRTMHYSTALVLPLEKAGGPVLKTKRDMIIVGELAGNPVMARYVKPGDVPKDGYFIRTLHENGNNIVVLAGDGPEETLYATFHFLDVIAPDLERGMGAQAARYSGTFFRTDRVPSFTYRTAPQTKIRSIFSWGHVIDDYNETFRALARARFNRAILWNDQLVVNSKDVVDCAHSWGVQVYWGFSWGWTLSGKDGPVDFDKLADEIVAEWRSKWKGMGGDGIYFQSFTETNKKQIGGRSIPDAVVELVNKVASRIRAEAPGTDIVFGLHSNSMRNPEAVKALPKTDPSIEILWENCGGFPYWEADGKVMGPDIKFNERILALTPNVGLAWKAQMRMDWKHYIGPKGPFMLGCAGRRLLERDQAVIAPVHYTYDEDWILNGKTVWEFIRRIRAGKNLPREFNAVAEYNPPLAFATLIQAELFWDSSDSWEEISRRARMRARPER